MTQQTSETVLAFLASAGITAEPKALVYHGGLSRPNRVLAYTPEALDACLADYYGDGPGFDLTFADGGVWLMFRRDLTSGRWSRLMQTRATELEL